MSIHLLKTGNEDQSVICRYGTDLSFDEPARLPCRFYDNIDNSNTYFSD